MYVYGIRVLNSKILAFSGHLQVEEHILRTEPTMRLSLQAMSYTIIQYIYIALHLMYTCHM